MMRGGFTLATVVAGCFASLGFATSPLAQTPQRGGTAIFVLSQEPPSVNPATTSGVPDRMIGCILNQGLIQVSPDYKIQPLLAKSWTISPDGLTYSFDLTKAEWHDGKPVTSDDVKYSLLEVNSKFSSIFAPAGKAIASIETPASDKVVIKLKDPFGPFMLSLACTQGGAIVPAHVFQGTDVLKNPANTATPVGTGAFILKEWKHGDYVRLTRNPKYFEPDRPYLDEVVGKIITQPAARVQALQAGEVDIVQGLSPNEQAIVRANPKLKLEDGDVSSQSTMLFFNTKGKILGDKRIRQALFMATDRDYLFKNAFQSIGSVGIAPFTIDIPWAANPAIDYRKMYPFDVARANALLDEAGMKRGADGKRFSLHIIIFTSDYPEFQEVSVALKSMWQAVGVDLVIDAMERASILKRIYQDHDFDMTMGSYASFYDPALGIARAFVTSTIGSNFGNASVYSNPEVDELFEKGQRGTSFEERGKYYQQAQAILAVDLPTLQFRQFRYVDGSSTHLHNLWGKIQSTGGLWSEAWIDK